MGDPHERIRQHYTEAGPSYRFWSDRFNMHYGYWKPFANPARREPMLETINAEVYRRCRESVDEDGTLLDAGCGLGATGRHIAREAPGPSVVGVTVVPWQARAGQELADEAGAGDRLSFLCADYRSVPLPDDSVGAAYAIESSCYAGGDSKADLLHELHRLLEPGGRFVFADVYRKRRGSLPRLARRCDRAVRDCWAIPRFGQIDAVTAAAREIGFDDVTAEEISWRVAPSVAHTPFVTGRYLFDRLLGSGGIAPEEWKLAKASLLSVLLGLFRRHFGYYFVSGSR